MKMHPASFNDPIIYQPEPITLFLPVIEESLSSAGIKSSRDEIIQRFMAGVPRLAVVYGSRDHPAQTNDEMLARMAIRAIWGEGAIPFELIQSAICDGIAQGHEGMRHSLLSRNLTTASLVGQIEAHGYQGALVITSCDKRPVGELAALMEVDIYRQKRGLKPFFAAFLPSNVMPEGSLPEKVWQELIEVQKTLPDKGLREEISSLLKQRLKCNTYAMFKKLLDSLWNYHGLPEEKRDYLEAEIAKATCPSGGTCAFLGTGNTDKIILAALGLVPRGLEFLPEPATPEQIHKAVASLMEHLRRGDEVYSISSLVRANLENAMVAWATSGGSMNWALHFPYIAAHAGIKVSASYLARLSRGAPHILEIDPAQDKSFFTLAERSAQGNLSGIDTLMKVLYDKGLVKDAPTMSGNWRERVLQARGGDGYLVHTRPLKKQSGVMELKGNLCQSALLKWTGLENGQWGGRWAYYAVFYLGEKEAQEDLFHGGRVLNRLKTTLSKEGLLASFQLNFPEEIGPLEHLRILERDEVFDWMVENRYLRVLIVIAGEGPRASGMPEMYYPSEYLNRDPRLRFITALLTDGRYSGATYGLCIGHCSPEAYGGGGIGAIETGDLIGIDFQRGRMDLLEKEATFREAQDRSLQWIKMNVQKLLNRPVLQERIREIKKRQALIPSSVRVLLDHLAPATEGAVFKGMENEGNSG